MPRVTTTSSQQQPDNPRVRYAETSKRATLRAAQEANRRRALPRWAEPAMKVGRRVAPLAVMAAIGGWGWMSGYLPMAVAVATDGFLSASINAGLSVQDVQVVGREKAAPADILNALAVQRGTPILAFDPHVARASLEQIPWVREARVERRLPNTIAVAIVEREPMALWQQERQMRLIDADGVVLTASDLSKWPNLPLLVGVDAPKRGPALLKLLAKEPTIGSMVEAAVLVGGRRWDLRLKNGVDVRLPEHDMAQALNQLAMVQQTNGVLDRDVVAVDLRIPDRLSIQTSAAAADARRKPPEKKQKT